MEESKKAVKKSAQTAQIATSAKSIESMDSPGIINDYKFIPESVYDDLPEPLNQIILEFEGRERDIVFLSSIVALSACTPGVYFYYGRKKVHPNLYLFIIAPAASGKGEMLWAKLLIDKIHDTIVLDSKQKISEFQNSSAGNNHNKPQLKVKIVPGNVTSAKFYKFLQNADDSLIIFESEADTLSSMLNQDFGDFSDVLRKAFHHESSSVGRSTNDIHYEIKNPKLSIVVSGTPNQVKPLIDSKENGLYSRFSFYYFDDVCGWKDMAPNASYNNLEDKFLKHGDYIYDLYTKLKIRNNPLQFKLTKSQWEKFQNIMSATTDAFIQTKKTEFLSVVKRSGLMTMRIACILTVLRNAESINDDVTELACSDHDLSVAIEVIRVLMEHSLLVFDKYSKDAIIIPVKERILLATLPKNFTRAIGLEVALKLNFKERNFDNILSRWVKNGVVLKESHGEYQKSKLI